MKKQKGLTMKQEAFCQEYITNMGNASAAYRHAYTVGTMLNSTIENNAYKLLNHNDVATRIAEIRNVLEDDEIISKVDVLKEMAKIVQGDITDEKMTYAAKIGAAGVINKMKGYDAPSKVQVSGDLDILGKLSDDNIIDHIERRKKHSEK